MNKETPTNDQKLKLKEELIDKFIAFWIEDNDYLDLMFNILNTLISEKDDYRFFALDDILLEALGSSLDDKKALLSNYLYSGLIKDWIKVLTEIHRHLEDKLESNVSSLVSYILESENLVEDTILGLARSLSKEKIDNDVQEKLIPLLQNFLWKINAFPKFYQYLVICHGIIGSKKSLPFLRSIIEESDIFSGSFNNDSFGEHINDHFKVVRNLAIKALVKISDKNELNYLVNRFQNDCSLKVKQVILFELKKFNVTTIFEEKLKDYKRFEDLLIVESSDRDFVFGDFDEVYKKYL